jgi:hypothetical protein
VAKKVQNLLKWFAGCGDRYVRAYLTHVDPERLATDSRYGLKLLFYSWAFERAGAPRAYRIAAVKAVSSLDRPGELPALFRHFCRGKLNPKLNPLLDRRAGTLEIPRVVRLVAAGDVGGAFAMLRLRGLGHKLRAFFLRDLVTVLKAEPQLHGSPEAYLWCQPIDVWVRMAAKAMCGPTHIGRAAVRPHEYQLSKPDLQVADSIVRLSLDARVSPLKVNQGLWYFCSNVVADQTRVRLLLSSGDPRVLEDEVALMKGFLPSSPILSGAAG